MVVASGSLLEAFFADIPLAEQLYLWHLRDRYAFYHQHYFSLAQNDRKRLLSELEKAIDTLYFEEQSLPPAPAPKVARRVTKFMMS